MLGRSSAGRPSPATPEVCAEQDAEREDCLGHAEPDAGLCLPLSDRSKPHPLTTPTLRPSLFTDGGSRLVSLPSPRPSWPARPPLCVARVDLTARQKPLLAAFSQTTPLGPLQPFFFGSFETRLSTMALCQLLSHCVAMGNRLLCGVLVEEEEVCVSGGVQTRAQKGPPGLHFVSNFHH